MTPEEKEILSKVRSSKVLADDAFECGFKYARLLASQIVVDRVLAAEILRMKVMTMEDAMNKVGLR